MIDLAKTGLIIFHWFVLIHMAATWINYAPSIGYGSVLIGGSVMFVGAWAALFTYFIAILRL